MKLLTEKDSIKLLNSLNKGTEVSSIEFEKTKFKWPNKTYESVKFLNSNLGAPLVDGVLGLFGNGSKFIDCKFENVSMDGLNINKSQFLNCQFIECIIGKSFHGGFFRSKLINSEFINCWLSTVQWKDCEILNCSFKSIQGSQLQFKNCNIENCTLTSKKMGRIHFVDCRISKTDMDNLKSRDLYINVNLKTPGEK